MEKHKVQQTRVKKKKRRIEHHQQCNEGECNGNGVKHENRIRKGTK